MPPGVTSYTLLQSKVYANVDVASGEGLVSSNRLQYGPAIHARLL